MEGNDQNDFSIGQSDRGDRKKKDAPQTAEDRIKEQFGTSSDAHEDLKRKREEYAV